jgi:hypothetical protein
MIAHFAPRPQKIRDAAARHSTDSAASEFWMQLRRCHPGFSPTA